MPSPIKYRFLYTFECISNELKIYMFFSYRTGRVPPSIRKNTRKRPFFIQSILWAIPIHIHMYFTRTGNRDFVVANILEHTRVYDFITIREKYNIFWCEIQGIYTTKNGISLMPIIFPRVSRIRRIVHNNVNYIIKVFTVAVPIFLEIEGLRIIIECMSTFNYHKLVHLWRV